MWWHYLLLFCSIWLTDISDTTSCSRHYHSITSIESWAVQASVAEQQGDVMWHTARGLHTLICLSWKIQLEEKKEERDQDYGITNGECYKTRWKMGILILDCFAPSSRDLQRPDAGGWRERCVVHACEWILTLLEKCISECLSSCCRAHTISPLQNKQRMWWSKGF